MPAFDDDDLENYQLGDAERRRYEHEDEPDTRDDPDPRDLAPDERDTTRCQNCRKYIFADSVRCPYCKHLQMEHPRSRKPLWFLLTAVVLLAIVVLTWVFWGQIGPHF